MQHVMDIASKNENTFSTTIVNHKYNLKTHGKSNLTETLEVEGSEQKFKPAFVVLSYKQIYKIMFF
jgi:hypothetical protein